MDGRTLNFNNDFRGCKLCTNKCKKFTNPPKKYEEKIKAQILYEFSPEGISPE